MIVNIKRQKKCQKGKKLIFCTFRWPSSGQNYGIAFFRPHHLFRQHRLPYLWYRSTKKSEIYFSRVLCIIISVLFKMASFLDHFITLWCKCGPENFIGYGWFWAYPNAQKLHYIPTLAQIKPIIMALFLRVLLSVMPCFSWKIMNLTHQGPT